MKIVPLLLSAATMTAISAQAQMTVLKGTTVKVDAGTTVSLADLDVETDANVANEGKLEFSGDVTYDGVQPMTGLWVAKGKQQQKVGGASPLTMDRLLLNNAKGVLLNQELSINNQLGLEPGVLFASEHPVKFKPTALDVRENKDGYIYGTAVMETRSVPVDTLRFIGAHLDGNGTTVGKISITRTTGEKGIKMIDSNTSIAANWVIDAPELDAAAPGRIDVALSWVRDFDVTRRLEDLRLYGTTKRNNSMFVMLDVAEPDMSPLYVDESNGTRTYKRGGLDYASRTLTLAPKERLRVDVEIPRVTMFPNPASEYLSLQFEYVPHWLDPLTIKITDAYGKVWMPEQKIIPDGNLVTVRGIGGLPPGVYRLIYGSGKVVSMVNFIVAH